MIAVFKPAPMAISIERYDRPGSATKMAAAGVLTRDDRVQLIDGEILEMAPIGTRHGSVAGRLMKRLILAAGDAAIVRTGNPVNLQVFLPAAAGSGAPAAARGRLCGFAARAAGCPVAHRDVRNHARFRPRQEAILVRCSRDTGVLGDRRQ